MALPWEADPAEEEWSDREAWRGDRYPDAADRWMEEETASPEPATEEGPGSGTWCAATSMEETPEELAELQSWIDKHLRQPPTG